MAYGIQFIIKQAQLSIAYTHTLPRCFPLHQRKTSCYLSTQRCPVVQDPRPGCSQEERKVREQNTIKIRLIIVANWYCIYTKHSQEDSVCSKLMSLPGIEVFNPKIKVKKCIRSKTREIVEGLFPCYIFTSFRQDSYFHTIQYTRGVRRFVGSHTGHPYVIDPCIIDSIKSGMKAGFVTLDLPKFTEGEKVVILDGPFSGLTGLFVKELNANERVLVLLNAICAKLEIHGALLAKA